MRMRGIKEQRPEETALALVEKVPQLLRRSLAEGTLRRYRGAFKVFASWCRINGRACMPAAADAVALFLADMAERYHSRTIDSMLSAIALAHRAAGESFDRKQFDRLLQGIRRAHGTAPRRAAPLTVGELRTILTALPDTAKGARDRALLTVGFAGALRRTELVALDLGPPARNSRGCVWVDAQGATLALHTAKNDATGNGHSRWLPRGGNPCPVAALERWLAISGITCGPVFRGVTRGGSIGANRLYPDFVGELIKDLVHASARRAGMSKAQAKARAALFSSHSLRSGFVTSAVMAGVSSEDIAAHVGWSSTQFVFAYVREVDPFKGNPAQLVLSA